jgi:hypothetical protein
VNQPEDLYQPDPHLEQQLTQVLRPVAPPEGFADRVMARSQSSELAANAIPAAKVIVMPSRSNRWASGALAATLLLAALLTQQTHARHQRKQAERAQEQFEAGLRITGETLEQVRLQLRQAGIPTGN